jgi:hypothetical protein
MLRSIVCLSVLVLIPKLSLCAEGNRTGDLQPCSAAELTAVVTPANPVYAETRDLTRELQNDGFVVRCVLGSKFADTFQGQLGAALYKTNRGDFETLFLPKSATFDSVRLVEHHQDGRYQYSFQGSPSAAIKMDGPTCTYFAKRANHLFISWGGLQLAADLGEVLKPI